jgi:hypothetical protein
MSIGMALYKIQEVAMMKVYTSVFLLEGLGSALDDLEAMERAVALCESGEPAEARRPQAVEQGVKTEARNGTGGKA